MKTTDGSIPLHARPSLADEYASFARALIPADAGPVQRTEMRRAFYGGAAAMFWMMTGELDAAEEPTELDVEYLDRLHRELAAFAHDVAEGRG